MRSTGSALLLMLMALSTGVQAAQEPAIEAIRIAWRSNGVEAATEAADKAVAALPNSAQAWYVAAGAYGGMAQSASIFSKMSWAKKCLDAYLQAVALDPRHYHAQLDLMGFYLEAPGIAGGGRDKADAQVAVISKLDVAWGHRARARIALADEDETAYEREARAAIAANPLETLHRVDMVMRLAGRERWADGFALLDDGLLKMPDDVRLNYQLGRLAAISGQQLQRGIAALDKLPGVADKPDDFSEGGMVWRRAMILEKLGRKDEALSEYRRAMQLESALKQQIETDIARVQKS
jgi:tetratricopeptide (TPR) repeat protein